MDGAPARWQNRGTTKRKPSVNPHPGTKPGTKPKDEPPTLDRTTFGHRLRTARKRFGWTLAQLAERSGVSITTISRAERGQLALGYENFTALGRALEMDMNAMFAGAGVKPAQLHGPVVTRAGKGVVYRGLSIAYEFLGTTAAGKQMSDIEGEAVHQRLRETNSKSVPSRASMSAAPRKSGTRKTRILAMAVSNTARRMPQTASLPT